MGKKPIVLGVLVLFAALLIALLVAFLRPPSPGVTIRHIKSVQSSNSVMLTFEITNHTTGSCLVNPVAVEIRNGSVWTSVLNLNPARPTASPIFLRQHAAAPFTQEVTNLPTACPVRLRTIAHRGLNGPAALLTRFELRFLRGQKRVPANPFDKSVTVFGNRFSITSDEFVEPEPKLESQGNSEK